MFEVCPQAFLRQLVARGWRILRAPGRTEERGGVCCVLPGINWFAIKLSSNICSRCGKLMTRTEAKQHELLCPADGQSKAGGHAQSNYDSKASATDALSTDNPNPSETASVGGHSNHTA